MEVWAGLGRLSPAAWACAGFAALAVFGLIQAPGGRLRPGQEDRDAEPGGRRIRGPSWLAGRSDGLALGRRLLLGAVAAAGALPVCIAAGRRSGQLGVAGLAAGRRPDRRPSSAGSSRVPFASAGNG